MPGLNKHSKLYTPNGLAMLVIFMVAWLMYFYEVDVAYHFRGFTRTVASVLSFVGIEAR